MRTIMVMNAKGGCGKSTLATNIAAYFASGNLYAEPSRVEPLL